MFRVVWNYDRQWIGSVEDLVGLASESLPHAKGLLDGLPLSGLPEPVFRRSSSALRARLLATARRSPTSPIHDLAGYHHAFFADLAAAREAARRVAATPGVRWVDVEARPSPCFMRVQRHAVAVGVVAAPGQPTPDFRPLQGYLERSPGGIGAVAAWPLKGGRGAGITLVDVEYGWNFEHEDLREGSAGVIFGPLHDDDHGTAVLGILSADPNRRGVTGIAPSAVAAAASADVDASQKWNAADAIYEASRRLHPGDVILLEMHSPGPGAQPNDPTQAGYIAVEFWDDNFDAIRDAGRNGIVVVEAAGNGNADLDSPAYQGKFDRAYRDSLAILVGAGASALDALPRSRLWFSNYGSRLDVQGWGEDVVTCGGRQEASYHDLHDGGCAARCYTRTFGGTSSATPIVAGAVACLQGALIAAGRDPLSSTDMRSLLVETGSAQGGNTAERIGPLPDLAAALRLLRLA